MKRIPLFVPAVALCVIFLAAIPVSVSEAAYLIYELFEGPVFPPTGWIPQGIDRIPTPPGPARSPTHSILINMRSDLMKTPLLSSPDTLQFAFRMEDISQTLTVESAPSSAGPWTAVLGSPFSVTSANNWTLETVDLSSQTNIYLRFKLTSTTVDYPVYLDDISVTSTGGPDVTPTPTPVPTTPPSQGFIFVVDDVVDDVPCPTPVALVTCNKIVEDSAIFNDSALNTVLEVVSGDAKGKRFFVDYFTQTTLYCNAGLLDNHTVSMKEAGIDTGDKCSLLTVDLVASGQCVWIGPNTLQDIAVTSPDWATDAFTDFYVYLQGDVGADSVRSFFTIDKNTKDTFSVFVSGLPLYSGTVDYMIVTNPPPVQTTPVLLLGTDSYPDPACDICIRIGLNFTLVPLQTGTGWNPLNQVDPYVAVQFGEAPNFGPLLFFHNGGWHTKVQPVYRGFVIGSEVSGTLGVFLMGPPMPSGKYTVYGVLNTPGASVWNERYRRSNLATVKFDFP